MRRLLYVVACMVITVAGFALPSRAPALTRGVGLLKQRVEFTVTNPAENGASHQIVGYRVAHNGDLTQVSSVAVPVGAAGIAAR